MPRKGQIIDITGNTYGEWKVLEFVPAEKKGSRWLCECSCGNQRVVYSGHLKNGASKSCGCKMPKGESHVRYKHGMSETPEFKIWLQMHTRCYNPNAKGWEHYGGKGVYVCDRWKEDFTAFYADMGPRPSPNHSIDRYDIDRGYEPGNCRWATDKEQARNTSRTKWVTYEGKRMSLAEACELSGMNYGYAQERLASGKGWRA